MDPYQLEVARKTVPGEFQMDVKHTRGILVWAGTTIRTRAPPPHPPRRRAAFGRQYTVFGKIISGDETLRAMETAPTRREASWAERRNASDRSTYVTTSGGGAAKADAECEQKLRSEAQGGWTGDGTGGDSSTASSGDSRRSERDMYDASFLFLNQLEY